MTLPTDFARRGSCPLAGKLVADCDQRLCSVDLPWEPLPNSKTGPFPWWLGSGFHPMSVLTTFCSHLYANPAFFLSFAFG